MRPQLLMFCFGVFIVGTLLSCIISGRWLVNGEINIINSLASFNAVGVQSGGMSMISTLLSYWDGVVTMLTWNYPYLDNVWGNIFKLFLYIISIGIVYGFIQLFIMALSAVVSAIRSLLPV